MSATPRVHRTDSDSTAPGGDNSRYQIRLAESLVASVGPDEAVQVCRENGWEGVLGVVLALQESARRNGLDS